MTIAHDKMVPLSCHAFSLFDDNSASEANFVMVCISHHRGEVKRHERVKPYEGVFLAFLLSRCVPFLSPIHFSLDETRFPLAIFDNIVYSIPMLVPWSQLS